MRRPWRVYAVQSRLEFCWFFSIEHAITALMKHLIQAEPAVPQLSTERLLDHPDNAALKAIIIGGPVQPPPLVGKAIAVITTDGVEEIELLATLQFLRDRGATAHLVAPPMPSLPAALGVEMPQRRETHILTIRYINTGGWVPIDRLIGDVTESDYDGVIIPGGAWNPDALRGDEQVLGLVRQFHDAGKPVAAICHGPWVLADAGLLKDRRATCWWSMKMDVINAGGEFVDQPVVVHRGVITSRFPGDLPAFLEAVEVAVLG